MLEAIARPRRRRGLQGVRRRAHASRRRGEYLALADELLGPAWATPATFRFGASGLLDDVLPRSASAGRDGSPAAY